MELGQLGRLDVSHLPWKAAVFAPLLIPMSHLKTKTICIRAHKPSQIHSNLTQICLAQTPETSLLLVCPETVTSVATDICLVIHG